MLVLYVLYTGGQSCLSNTTVIKRILFISGLGADEQAFSRIGILPYEKIYIKWLPSLEGETLEVYTQRLIRHYSITGSDILVGLSFGGLICQCIASMLKNNIVILLSSFRTKEDLKVTFRVPLKLGLHKLMPAFRIPIIDLIVAKILNGGTQESTPVLKNMLKNTDYKLMKWSLNAIADSKVIDIEETKVFSFIGTKDFIVKEWGNTNLVIVEGGSHFMTFDESEFITQSIIDILHQNG